MSVITDITKNVDARPLYAVVGVTDLTVEKAREAAVAAEAFGTALRADLDKFVADLAPAKVQERVQELPNTVAAESKANADKLVATYEDLAERGQKLVARIRNQKATQDLVAQAETTVAQAKGAVTTARKAAADIERSAKATVTTGRKEAVKAAEAITASVADEVKVAETEVKTAAKRTRTAAKRTSTTTRNAAKKTTASAKGVRTTAKKTAAATAKATEKAAEKVGD